MKKRLRKKLHLGEFKQVYFEVSFSVKENFNADKFIDEIIDFVDQLIPKYGFGGMTPTAKKQLGHWVIECGLESSSEKNEIKNKTINWFLKREDVNKINISEYLDCYKDNDENKVKYEAIR